MPRATLTDSEYDEGSAGSAEGVVIPTARQMSLAAAADASKVKATGKRPRDKVKDEEFNKEACYECRQENARVNDSIVFCENCGYG